MGFTLLMFILNIADAWQTSSNLDKWAVYDITIIRKSRPGSAKIKGGERGSAGGIELAYAGAGEAGVRPSQEKNPLHWADLHPTAGGESDLRDSLHRMSQERTSLSSLPRLSQGRPGQDRTSLSPMHQQQQQQGHPMGGIRLQVPVARTNSMINTRDSIPLGTFVQEDVEAARLGNVVPRPPSFISAPARLSLNSPEQQQRAHTIRLSSSSPISHVHAHEHSHDQRHITGRPLSSSPSLHGHAHEQSLDQNRQIIRPGTAVPSPPRRLHLANHPGGHHL